MQRRWVGALGVLLSAVLLVVAFKDTHWGDVAAAIRDSNLALWAAATVTSQLTFPLRAARWRVILAPVAANVTFSASWRATAVGMMVNNTLVARLGEPTRAYVLARQDPRVPFTSALATLVVDRTFDALVVLLLLLVAVLHPSFAAQTIDGRAPGTIVLLAGGFVAAAFAGLYLAVFAPSTMERIAAAVVRPVLPNFVDRVQQLVRNVTAGLAVLRDPAKLASIFGWTLAHWLMNALAFWLGFKALGLEAPFLAALLTQGIIVIAVALPQGPAFVGAFEWAAMLGLGVYGVADADAAAWAVTYHLLSFIPITLIGLFYLARLGISLGAVRATAASAAVERT